MNKQHFKETITKLVETFERNKEVYKDRQSAFNEAQLREQFLNPMFKALGWDMNNEQGYAEQYKEVVHEDKVYVKGKPKAPDYSFRIGGQRKFFLEAKQPFVKIKTDYDPALQLRRYAWSAHLPISILTDFEEFAIYDTTIEPKPSDKASKARINYFTYEEYIERSDEIYDLFAKESILKGSFDKYTAKEKRGNQVVDKIFLKELETWREWLARDIARNNPELTVEELNFSIQKLIDRIIFLRIAEDRGIERYKTLEETIKHKDSYTELHRHFKLAHEKYNSSLFDFESDTITPKLKVTDKVLDKILAQLYYPNSPYEFSVLGVELLGSIYEQFLGKVIRLTDKHNAVVEEKPEVKKAGGVYYTPQYIVEYIVKNTVGELVKDKSPRQVEKIKVLDPACGSGSFLIGAYEFLLDWHLDYYLALSDKEKQKLEKKRVIFKMESKDPSGDIVVSWHLTTSEKKRIMLNNIYGVDIDSQAVEVTKLSLALKMLENENQETINKQLKLLPERILPDISSNIKCGNSLVGSDYWDDKNLSEVSEEDIKKVKAFDWDVEFKDIFDKGGFDAVIGNPPYVRQELFKEYKPYFQKKYNTYAGTADLYTYFIESGVEMLNSKGVYSIIVANKWMRARFGKELREYLKKKQIIEIVDFGDLPVFETATTYPCILTVKGGKSQKSFRAYNVANLDFVSLNEYLSEGSVKVNQKQLESNGWSLIDVSVQDLLIKLDSSSIQISKYLNDEVHYGIKTGYNKAFVIDEATKTKLENEDISSKELIKGFIAGRDVKRYKNIKPTSYLIFTRRGVNIDSYPAIKTYLEQFKAALNPKPKDYKGNSWEGRKAGSYQWYEIQDTVDYYSAFEKTKIVYPNICKKPEFTLDKQGIYTNQKCFIIPREDLNLLGLLNSKLTHFWFETNLPKLRGGFYEPSWVIFKNFPVHNNVSELDIEKDVSTLLDLNKDLESVRSDTKRKVIKSQIDNRLKTIDKTVYDLYELTKDEIDIIESMS